MRRLVPLVGIASFGIPLEDLGYASNARVPKNFRTRFPVPERYFGTETIHRPSASPNA